MFYSHSGISFMTVQKIEFRFLIFLFLGVRCLTQNLGRAASPQACPVTTGLPFHFSYHLILFLHCNRLNTQECGHFGLHIRGLCTPPTNSHLLATVWTEAHTYQGCSLPLGDLLKRYVQAPVSLMLQGRESQASRYSEHSLN